MATPTASIAWEKRSNADGETFQSATFTVGGTAGPFACAGDPTNPVTVVDDATNDSDPLLGRYLLAGVCPGTYTVTETVPPPGAAVDPDPTREVTVSDGEAEFIGIPGEADDCPDEFPALDTSADDFCDPQLGSMAWEKRNQADEETFQSATFTVGGDTGPFACTGDPTNPVTVGDDADGIPGGGNDADPLVGRYLLDGVCPGTYTVTETVGPPGMGLESDATRVVTVADGEADSIGIPGEADECPDPEPANDTDEADYCDGASIAWEKRSQADEENFQSATFTVGGETGPFSCAGDPTNPVTVEDNSTNDIHPLVGVYVLAGVCPGTYTVTETVPPPGAVVDPDPTREGTVAEGEAASVGTMGESDDCPDATPATDADEADFCDPQLGSIAWEKRNQADEENFQSATFTVSGDTGPFACMGDPTNPVTVEDDADGVPGDGNDANPFIGQYLLDGVCPGTYTVTETIGPSGGGVEPDPTRVVTVADAEAASIGVPLENDDCPDAEPANDTDEADFCNGTSIAWEKRSQADAETFQSATFSVAGTPGPLACAGDPDPVTVEDNSSNDSDPLLGRYLLAGICPGTYTVTETVPAPEAGNEPDPTREVTVADGGAASIGTQGEADDCPDAEPGTDTDEADFCDPQLGSIAWEKRNQADAENFQSATFTVGGDTGPFACTGDPTNPVTVGDDADGIPGDGNDANPFIGQYLLDGVCPGTYTVTETVPPAGMVVDPDPSRVVTVADGEAASIGTPLEADDCPDPEPANDSEDADFCNLPESAVTFPESAVTNSAGCAFDAFEPEDGLQHFKLIFTPDPNNVPYYKLTASNPGQFLFNVVYEGSPGDVVTFDVELPYPFVTQGAMPIHVYESVFVLDDCFVAGTPISASSQGVTLADYGGTFGSTETMSIGPITAGPTGLVYVTIHLDHGLEGFRNYEKVPFSNSAKSPGNSALPASPQPIDDMGAYAFSVSGAVSDVQTIHNANVFKHDPGFAGLVTDVFGNPLAGVLVHVRGPDGSLVAAVSTDADGYWSYAYKHKGKAATFTVGLPAYGVEVAVPVKANSFVWVDLVVPP